MTPRIHSAQLATAFSAFALVSVVIQVMQPALSGSVWMIKAGGMSVFYTVMFLLVFRATPWRCALCWLGIPALVFTSTWLRWYWALPLTTAMLTALWICLRSDQSPKRDDSLQELLPAALIILVWVSFSGAGGYGFQNMDYVMHNGRLIDLVENAWPVSYNAGNMLERPEYADRQLMVVYSGYYLLGALAGKAFGMEAAMDFMHCWTVAGCWIAFRFLWRLCGVSSGILVALVMIGFAGWDFLGWACMMVVQAFRDNLLPDRWLESLQFVWTLLSAPFTPVWLDFWAGDALVDQYHFGNFLSLTAELFWSPHHTVASWLTVALLWQAWQQHQYRLAGFLYALLALFSPLMFMSLALFPAMMLLQGGRSRIAEWISFPNITGAVFITVLALYYWSSSATSNPHGLILLKDGWRGVPWLALFHLVAWGVYALAVRSYVFTQDIVGKWFFLTMCALFLLLPFFRYGIWNDLMIRSSAPLYFCMAVFMLRAIGHSLSTGERRRALILVLLMVPGSLSTILNIRTSIAHLGYREPAQRVVDYDQGWIFLGSIHSFYVRYLSAPIPANKPE